MINNNVAFSSNTKTIELKKTLTITFLFTSIEDR